MALAAVWAVGGFGVGVGGEAGGALAAQHFVGVFARVGGVAGALHFEGVLKDVESGFADGGAGVVRECGDGAQVSLEDLVADAAGAEGADGAGAGGVVGRSEGREGVGFDAGLAGAFGVRQRQSPSGFGSISVKEGEVLSSG